ncbi:chromate efflux transporter [Aurantiacibacter arachoides]|uniref:chromate efflux transporter n=1 Tax=Aurantiacibacter arachoides TaxID=1850444 RepID=UPI001F1FA9FE|nr:chromate efflux transporter [Aurantiacibacter arachoides]
MTGPVSGPGQLAGPTRPIALGTLFLRFLRFGALAFGGPVAQIAMVREELVEKAGWIDGARFNRLLAVMQALPGPEAHELCVHMGMVARGRIGGLLAGLGFMLPGFALMMLLGWIYATTIEGNAGFAPVLLGIQIAVLAVIARAIPKIGRHILKGHALYALAVIALAATLAGVPFWVPLIAAGVAHAAVRSAGAAVTVVGLAVLATWWMVPAPVPLANVPVSAEATLLALFGAGLKGGLLTFGGAYTAIPYVRADTVGRGWLTDGQFLDGVALANVLPAPLVIFATFVGYVAGGPWGAIAITLGMFLPAFAFSMLFFERLEAVIDEPRLHRLLDGMAAAAVGIIAATLVQLALAIWPRIDAIAPALAIFVFALIAAFTIRRSWATPAIILAAGLAGWLSLG